MLGKVMTSLPQPLQEEDPLNLRQFLLSEDDPLKQRLAVRSWDNERPRPSAPMFSAAALALGGEPGRTAALRRPCGSASTPSPGKA